MACRTLESSIQDLATKRCFVSYFETQRTGQVNKAQTSSSRSLNAALQKSALNEQGGLTRTASPARFPAGGRSKEKVAEPADKPGSVVDSHSSRRIVADTLKQPTRTRRGPRHESLFGLAPGGVCHAGLLPDSRCALTAPFHPCHASRILANTRPFGGLLSVALSVGSRRPGVTWHRALWSPDFPRHRNGLLRCDDATVWPTPPRAVYRLRVRFGGLCR